MDSLFHTLATLPIPAPQVHVIVDNVTASVEASTYKDALVAIASVAAVLWTGGLIIRQLFPSYVTMIVQNGMFFTIFAAFASLGALVTHGDILRIVVACFFLWYVGVAILSIRHFRRQRRKAEPLPEGVDEARYFKLFNLGNWLQVLLLVFYIPIMVYPTTECVAWVTFFALFLGYQMILTHLNQARQKDDGTTTTFLGGYCEYCSTWNGGTV